MRFDRSAKAGIFGGGMVEHSVTGGRGGVAQAAAARPVWTIRLAPQEPTPVSGPWLVSTQRRQNLRREDEFGLWETRYDSAILGLKGLERAG